MDAPVPADDTKRWKPRPAHNCKLNLEVHKKVVEAIRNGASKEAAAGLVGVTQQTLHNWIAWGRRDHESDQQTKYRRLFEAVAKAESDLESESINRIRKAGSKHWQALAWLLERKYPDRYGQTHIINVKVKREVEELFEALRDGLTPDEFAKVVDVLSSRFDVPEIEPPDALDALALPPTTVRVEDAES